jgi:hypothetical protein
VGKVIRWELNVVKSTGKILSLDFIAYDRNFDIKVGRAPLE